MTVTGLEIHRSARIEALLDPLIAYVRDEAPADPFAPVRIVVQSRGMERWLSHQLAQGLQPGGGGIRASVEFPFPASIVGEVVRACDGAVPDPDPWDPDRSVWPLLEAMAAVADRPEFDRVARYLATGTSAPRPAAGAGGVVDRRAWRFARSVADVFDRYRLHRPQLAHAWSRGRSVDAAGAALPAAERWQLMLWQELVARSGDPTLPTTRAIAALTDPAVDLDLARLPTDLAFFGISSLPPLHLDVITALATRTRVQLFLPTPSPVRWATVARARAATERGAPPSAAHPLLVSCGRLADDAAILLADRSPSRDRSLDDGPGGDPGTVPDVGPDVEVGRGPDVEVEGPGPASLLEALQDGVRSDRIPAPGADHDARFLVATDDRGIAVDRSVQVHRCHGPARQAEVLRDVVLRLLEPGEHPGRLLEPRDVLVMTPDIETYAPLIQAAFAPGGDTPGLPVKVADRHLGSTNVVADVLLAVLGAAGGRLTASELLDLLGRAPVAARFRFSADDLARIRVWVMDTGIRWGIDRDHRRRQGQPGDAVHTWRFGLDRLLLGAAMPDEGHRSIAGIHPYDHMEGDDVALLGRFADACTTVFDLIVALQDPRPVAAWRDVLDEVLARCVEVAPTERWWIQEVRAALDAVVGASFGAQPDPVLGARPAPVPGSAPDRVAGRVADPAPDRDPPLLDLGAIRGIVEHAVGAARGAAGYETGAVTVCALVPMRSIPHQVVCIVGLDDGAFPRSSGGLGFDLTEREDAVGDRNRRDEDRFLFLEALLAARRHLVLTATGRDVRTNEPRPTAVPLAELLDVLDRVGTTGAADRPVRATVTTDHPLQAFSPRNFGITADGDVAAPVAYDRSQLEAAEAARSPRRGHHHFLDGSLPVRATAGSTDPDVEVPVADLVAALVHPTRHLLQRRLGLHLREFRDDHDDQEPFELDHLLAARFGRDLLAADPGGAGDPGAGVPGVEPSAGVVGATEPGASWLDATVAAGVAPAATPGRVQLAEVVDDVDRVRGTARSLLDEAGWLPSSGRIDAGSPYPIRVSVGTRRVVGTLDGVFGAAADAAGERPPYRLTVRYVRPRPGLLLGLWVEHLVMVAGGAPDATSALVVRPKSGAAPHTYVLGPLDADPAIAIDRAQAWLGDLVAIHDQALHRPLPLFERASAKLADTGDFGAARDVFPGSDWARGDLDEDVEQAYGPDLALDDVLPDAARRDEFVELAARVYEPALAYAALAGAVPPPAEPGAEPRAGFSAVPPAAEPGVAPGAGVAGDRAGVPS